MVADRRPVVVVDRDGVINEDSIEYIKSPAEWQPLPGALAAIARLNRAGFRVAVATNQSGIGRGLFTEETLAAIHAKMLSLVADAGGRMLGVFYCPHTPWDECDCRKPKPGLLFRIAAAASVAPDELVFIGDKPSDVEAARAAGARPILVAAGAGDTLAGYSDVQRFRNLAAAADSLIAAHAGSA